MGFVDKGYVLRDRYIRLFELVDNKMMSVAEVNLLGWGRGETWKWRRRLLAWEEELMGSVVLC